MALNIELFYIISRKLSLCGLFWTTLYIAIHIFIHFLIIPLFVNPLIYTSYINHPSTHPSIHPSIHPGRQQFILRAFSPSFLHLVHPSIFPSLLYIYSLHSIHASIQAGKAGNVSFLLSFLLFFLL